MSKLEGFVAPCALPPKVYPVDKLHWHFTCGFDLRHSQRLPVAAVLLISTGLKHLIVFLSFNWCIVSPCRSVCCRSISAASICNWKVLIETDKCHERGSWAAFSFFTNTTTSKLLNIAILWAAVIELPYGEQLQNLLDAWR